MNYQIYVGLKFTEGDDNLEVTDLQSVHFVDGIPKYMIFRAWSTQKLTKCTRLFEFDKFMFSDGKFITK